jgi:hypothetical protein
MIALPAFAAVVVVGHGVSETCGGDACVALGSDAVPKTCREFSDDSALDRVALFA